MALTYGVARSHHDNASHQDDAKTGAYMQSSMRVRYVTMTMRPGLFFQREGPGSEPGNSLLRPDEAACSVCGVLGILQCRTGTYTGIEGHSSTLKRF